jgi:predicted secreted protein
MGTKIRFCILIYFLNESDKSQLTFQPAKNKKTLLLKYFFTQLFRQFRILNCNLSRIGGIIFTMQFPMATVKKNAVYMVLWKSA